MSFGALDCFDETPAKDGPSFLASPGRGGGHFWPSQGRPIIFWPALDGGPTLDISLEEKEGGEAGNQDNLVESKVEAPAQDGAAAQPGEGEGPFSFDDNLEVILPCQPTVPLHGTTQFYELDEEGQ